MCTTTRPGGFAGFRLHDSFRVPDAPRVIGRVLSIQVGSAAPVVDLHGRIIRSAISKEPLDGVCAVGWFGLEGDEHGDPRNHGGADKAVCLYPAEHYPIWERRLGKALRGGAFGENITTCGCTEDGVCIGDLLAIGTAMFEVSQPRQPCYRLAAFHGVLELAVWVEATGFTGFYCRVVRRGELAPGCAIELIERPHPDLTVSEANRVMHRHKSNLEAAERLLVQALSNRWQATLRRRLRGDTRDMTVARLYGD
jgi:MOSC domain-containing protein YiiM